MHPLVGLVLTPDPRWLGLMRPLLPRVGLFVLTPETLWKPGPDGALRPNSYHREFLALRDFSGKPFAAHSVGMSPGSPDSPRRQRWLSRMALEQEHFGFLWWTDHAGYTEREGQNLALPSALPDTPGARDRQRQCLAQMAEIVHEVGLETSWFTSVPGTPWDEARLLSESTAGRRVLLDLHNLWAMGENLGFSVLDFVERLNLDQVIEIHVSGGRAAPNGARLDSHDTAIPEPVLRLLEQVAPRCAGLRAITLERFEGTVEPHDVRVLAGELDRIAEVCAACEPGPVALGPVPSFEVDALQPPAIPEHDELARGLIAKLRFERLVNGSEEASASFEADPAGFAGSFRRYTREVPATAWFPNDEGRLWAAWTQGGGGLSS